MSAQEKTHYRKAFNSPYLSSSDIVKPTVLTVAYVRLEPDLTKKTKDLFNTAHFVEKEIRKGEKLKPMILNAHNSKVMRMLTGSHFLEDWNDTKITVYVDNAVKFGRDTVEGLRISPEAPRLVKPELTKENAKVWGNAITAFQRDGDLAKVLERFYISEENQQLIMQEASNG